LPNSISLGKRSLQVRHWHSSIPFASYLRISSSHLIFASHLRILSSHLIFVSHLRISFSHLIFASHLRILSSHLIFASHLRISIFVFHLRISCSDWLSSMCYRNGIYWLALISQANNTRIQHPRLIPTSHIQLLISHLTFNIATMPSTNPHLCTGCHRKPHAPNQRSCDSCLVRIASNERAITNDSNRPKAGVTTSEIYDLPSPKLTLILSLPYLGNRFQQFQRRGDLLWWNNLRHAPRPPRRQPSSSRGLQP
jgi:hypothetical protein